MSRRTWQVYLIGLMLLGLLMLLAIPFYAKRIPQFLEDSASQHLHEAGIGWAGVTAEGRDLTLSGNAPTQASYQQALQTVRDVTGVRQVIDHMTPRLVKPYTMVIDWNDGKLAANGFVPDEASYQKLGQQVAAVYGSKQTDGQLQLALGNPAGWPDMLETVFKQIHALDDAHVEITDQQIYVSGRAALTTTQQQFAEAMEGLKQYGFNTEMHVISADAAIRTCQTKFDELLQTPILFNSGANTINPDSHPLLEKLSETAALCAGFHFTIAGHTDNQGNSETNRKLSEQRARAVANWLIREGIETSRITVIGHGSSQPVADNATEAGRAKNRRIEIIVQEN